MLYKYYIIRADGSSIFKLPYPEDFIYHCLINLSYRTDEHFSLLAVSAQAPFMRAATSICVALKEECSSFSFLKMTEKGRN